MVISAYQLQKLMNVQCTPKIQRRRTTMSSWWGWGGINEEGSRMRMRGWIMGICLLINAITMGKTQQHINLSIKLQRELGGKPSHWSQPSPLCKGKLLTRCKTKLFPYKRDNKSFKLLPPSYFNLWLRGLRGWGRYFLGKKLNQTQR